MDSLTDKRALLNCKVFGALSDVVAPVKKYLDANAAKQITVFADCVFALTGGGVFRTQNAVLTEANLDSGTFYRRFGLLCVSVRPRQRCR